MNIVNLEVSDETRTRGLLQQQLDRGLFLLRQLNLRFVCLI